MQEVYFTVSVMSFFNRLRSAKQENSKDATPEKFSDNLFGGHGLESQKMSPRKTTQPASSTVAEPQSGLSLFSGMTLSTVCSPQVSTSNSSVDQMQDMEHHKESCLHGVAFSNELQEEFAGIDMMKHPPVSSSQAQCKTPKPPHASPLTKKEENRANILSPGVQPTKKKKRTQSQRPGYARENDDACPQKPKQANSIPVQREGTRQGDGTDTAVKKTKDDPNDNQSSKEVLDEKHETSAIREHVLPSRTRLYSIGTPSSSEENLTDYLGDNTRGLELDSSELLERLIPEASSVAVENMESEGSQATASNETGSPAVNIEVNQDLTKTWTETPTEHLDLSSITLNPPESEQETVHVEVVELGNGKEAEETINNCADMVKDYTTDSREDDKIKLEEEKNSLSEPEMRGELSVEELSSSPENISAVYEVELDASEKFTLLEQGIHFKLSLLRDDENAVHQLEQHLIEFYSSNVDQQRQEDLEHLQQEEFQALASDNYDLAEQLNVQIEELKQKLESAKYQLPSVDQKVQESIKLRTDVTRRRLATHRDALVALGELREEQNCSLTSHQELSTTKTSREKQKLYTERQRLERAMGHVHLDREHLEKEEQQLEVEMSHRTAEFIWTRDELVEQREVVKEEIAELERKLIELRFNETSYSRDIEEQDRKIKAVEAEFCPQRDPLDRQRSEIEGKQKILNQDQESLTRAQENFNKSREERKQKEDRLQHLVESVESVMDRTEQCISVLESQRGDMELFQCIKHLSLPVDPPLEKLRKSFKQFNQQIKSLTTRINLSERGIASLMKRLSEIEVQITDRDEAKEIAKKERNFKEAKRLKEERDRLTVEGIESQKTLESLLHDQTHDKHLLKEAEDKINEIEDELKEREYESAVKLIHTAAQVVHGLQELSGRFTENKMLHTLVAAEMSSCQKILDELCPKHGIGRPVVEDTLATRGDTDEGITTEKEQQSKEDGATSYSNPEGEESESPTRTSHEELLNQLDELEGKLEAVVDMEDFDEADRIQKEIDDIKCKLDTLRDEDR